MSFKFKKFFFLNKINFFLKKKKKSVAFLKKGAYNTMYAKQERP